MCSALFLNGFGYIDGGVIGNSLLKTFLKTSIPAALDLVSQTITWSVEAILLGQLSAEALAGVGIALQVIILTLAIMLTFVVGSSIIILRHLGRNEHYEANHVLAQALFIGLMLSFVVGLFWYFGATQIFLFIKEDSHLARIYGTQYIKLIALAAPVIITNFIAVGIIRAAGHTLYSLLLNIGANVINLLLAPFLIYGWWFFPRLEVPGAAFAVITAHSLAFIATLYVLRSRKISLFIPVSEFVAPRISTFKLIIKLGLPTTIEQFVWAAGQLILSIYVAKLGVIYLAVHQILIRVQSIITMFYHGLGSGSMTMIGKFLGNKEISKFKKTTLLSGSVGGVLAATCGLIIFFARKYLVLVFNTDPNVVELGMSMMVVLALIQVPKGMNTVFSHSMRGGADIRWLMWITIMSVFIFEIGFAYAGVFLWGWALVGVWAIQGMDEFSRLLANYFRFYKRDWKIKALEL